MAQFMKATGEAARARAEVFNSTDGSSKVRSRHFTQASARATSCWLNDAPCGAAQWLGYFTTELGGNLNRVHHLYYYDSYEEAPLGRAARAASAHSRLRGCRQTRA